MRSSLKSFSEELQSKVAVRERRESITECWVSSGPSEELCLWVVTLDEEFLSL